MHKKSVLFQGESQSGYRLPRGLELSVAPLTRPESWSLLCKLTRETHKLLNRVGARGAVSRIDPIFYAAMSEGIEALGHISHMAQAFGVPAERVRPHVLDEGQQGFVFRDALLLHRATLEPVLDRWLLSLGVARAPMDAPLVLKPDGSTVVVADDQGYEIGQTVLADDGAILGQLSAETWPAIITAHAASTVLTETGKPLPGRLMYQLDSGLVLSQQFRRGLVALGPGAIEQVGQAVAAGLGAQRIRQAGQSSYQRIVAVDRAPVVGRVGGTGPDLVAGFGLSGAFFAPAIARWLAGTGSPEEKEWFAARLVDRDAALSSVAEWGDPL